MPEQKKFQYLRVVNKPNKIIQSSQSMTTIQQKMFFNALSQVKYKILSRENENREEDIQKIADTTYVVPIDEVFADFEKQKYSKTGGDLLNHIDSNMKAIVKQTISVKNVEKDTLSVYNIIRYAEWQTGKNNIEVKFSLDVIPILVDMVKEGYTKLSLENIVPLKNPHSIRIYEEIMLFVNLNKNKRHIDVKEYIISYADLRFLLGMDTSKEYKLFADFRRFVLHPVQKEIFLNTDLSFEIEEIRERNKVKYLRFYDITIKNEQIEMAFDEGENSGEILETKPAKFTEEQLEKLDKYLAEVFSADEIKEKYDFDYIEFYYDKARDLERTGSVRHFPSFFYKLLSEDKYNFAELKSKEQKKKEKEIAKQKAEKAQKIKTAQEEKSKREQEKAEAEKFEKIFDALSEEVREIYLQEVYAKNLLYKDFDKDNFSKFTKWAVGKLAEQDGITL